MKFARLRSFISSHKRYGLLFVLSIVFLSIFVIPHVIHMVRASFGTWGDTSLINGCTDSRGRVTLVSPGTNCNSDETQVTWLKDVDAGNGLSITRSSSGATLSLANNNGWSPAGETWTYDSADSPSFTFTISGDDTDKYSPGMRVKLTQSSTKYFIITAVSYSAPNTTVTVYGGTDYTLANATITNPYYSSEKAPQGFPLNPNKWTVEISNDTTASQANPTAGTWYNLSSLSISIPVGVWNVEYHIPAYLTGGSNTSTASYTLSTSSSSESDPDFTSILGGPGGGAALGATVTKSKTLSLTSKTTYYVIEKVDVNSSILTLLSSYSKLFVRAQCAYL